MKKAVLFSVIAIIIIAGFSTAWYILTNSNQQSPPTSSLTPAATNTETQVPPPATTVTASISATPSLQLNGSLPNSGDTLIINGTVTNNSTNTAYDVGLKVSAEALVLGQFRTVIDVTIPIESGTYNSGAYYPLSTLAPNETVAINAVIYPYYPSQEPNLQGANVALVWSNRT
jgi:hypothetical protein